MNQLRVTRRKRSGKHLTLDILLVVSAITDVHKTCVPYARRQTEPISRISEISPEPLSRNLTKSSSNFKVNMIALNALGVLIAYLMILTPLAFADLVSDTPTTVASSAATKVEMTGSLVTRDTDKSYLTVISAARNLNNPTPGTQYIYDESAGAGTTIFVIDSGFNTANYEDEFCTDNGRWFETYAIPREIRSEMLTDREREVGVHFPPDDMADIGGIGSDNLIHGHGTHVAIAAAGCESGVAPRANLVLIKATEIKLNREGQVDASGRSSVYPQALIASLQFVIKRMEDTRGQEIRLGKAVVLLPFSLVIRNMGEDWGSDQLELFERDMNSTLSQLDAHGVSVVFPGGDSGHGQGKEDSGPDAKSDDYPYYTSYVFLAHTTRSCLALSRHLSFN